MKYLSFFFVSVCCLGLIGCSSNYDARYVSSRSVQPIVVPAGLSSSTIESSYPVPSAKNSAPIQPVDLTPPGS